MDKADWQQKGAGHRERLRQKFLTQGIDSLPDAEVLELILTFGTPRKDCKEAARALLKKFGSLAEVLNRPAHELSQVKGVGEKNIFAVGFIQGVARRYLKQRLTAKQYVRSSKDVADYLIHSMRDLKKEVLTILFLDASHGIIDSEIVAEGTLNANTIYPREIIKRSLHHHAAAVVIAHNHPSGRLEPSREDLRLTRSLFIALSFTGIILLDHLIVAGGQTYSFADHGHMAVIKEESAAAFG